MTAAGVILIALAVLIGYEALKGGFGATVASASSGGTATAPAGGIGMGEGIAAAQSQQQPAVTPPAITPNTTGSLTDYLRSILPVAQAHSARTGIPVSYYLGIIANESSAASRRVNALFGIQGTGFPYTDYHANGQAYQSALQANPSVDAAFQGFDNLISSGRYALAYNSFQQNHDIYAFFQGINRAGYSETPTWPDIIRTRAAEVRAALGIP